MSEQDKSIGGGRPIPSSIKGKVTEPVRHWWYTERSRSLSESSEPELAARSPTYSVSPKIFSFPSSPVGSPPDPKVAIPMPAPGDDGKFRDFMRRDSIKNMVFLDDFGTD